MRYFSISTILLAALLVSCSRGGSTKPTVAFVTNNPFEFWTIAKRGTEKAEAEFEVDVEFKMPPLGSAAEQKQIVEDLLSRGVKGIAISPLDGENQADFLNGVAERVPLLTQDSDLPEGSKRLCFIGTNNYEAGKAAGELVKEIIPGGGRLVIYVGKLDVQNAVERRQGVVDALAGEKNAPTDSGSKLGKYTLIDTMTDGGSQEQCKVNVDDTLVKHPDVDCLVGLWAYNPVAMLGAVKDAGKEGKVALVGFDENEETLQGIKEGHIHGTIVQDPFNFGYEAVKMLASLVKGDKSVIPEGGIMHVPHRVIKKDNVEEFHAELRKLKGK